MKPITTRGVAVLAAALLCAAVTACGTARPGDPEAVAPAAQPSTPSAPSANPCGDETTDTTEEGPSTGAGPATEDEAGTPGPPTDQDTGTPGPPTDADPGTPGPPTDGTAAPCLPAGWFDMTRDFIDYYSQHLTKADDGMWPSVVAVRIRKQGAAEEAVVTVNFSPPPGADDWEGRRVAEVFANWRHEAYGDKGRLSVETRSRRVITDATW
ncbi:hypothetical protein [Streptomyces sp. HUAS TT7]|uniref:hypothetical protein n=1 Tax=Streptomyces sp. HUAS TT7 TaxID=3447507 RepID=UPI003F65A1E2